MTDTTTLRYAGRVLPYTYIGDSHSGTIGALLFDHPESDERVVTQIAGIWRFVASDVLSEDGMIGDALMQALRRAGAFHSFPTFPQVPGLRPVTTTYGSGSQIEQLAITEAANERPYVLTVGEINNRYILQQLVSDGIDFEVPFDTAGLERFPEVAARQKVGAGQMGRILIEEFTPLFRGLRVLRDAGLRSLFLHSIPPPAVDDADSERVLRHPSPARLRYKLAMYVNFLFERVCREVGIGFINMWPHVTEGNILRPEFYLDGLHLNHQHSLLSVQEVHRQFSALRLANA